jgi:hypothetical protein
MSNKGVSDMINGVWRVKWYRYRYVLVAALIVNLLLINHFFEGGAGLNPFRSSPTVTNDFSTDPPVEYKTEPKVEEQEVIPPPPSPILENTSEPPQVTSTSSTTSEFESISSTSFEPKSTSAEVVVVVVESTSTELWSSSAALVPTPHLPYNGSMTIGKYSTSSVSSISSTSSTSIAPTRTRKPSPLKTVNWATVSPTIPASKSTFNLHDYNFNAEYVGWPLENLCKETEWVPGLTFVCDNNSGGIGNIRNFILTCIRYAIDAGASELILPRIQRRQESDLANIFTGGFQPFNYFFDEEHFRWVFNTHCPQMKIHNSTETIPYAENLMRVMEFYPKDLNVDLDGCDGRGVNRHLDQFRPKFHHWLNTKMGWPSVEDPISIRFKWATFFEWPIYRDGPELATTFGDILRIRKDIVELAQAALAEMSNFAGIKPREDIFEAPFLGVHLRTESDALEFWPSFDEQSDGYLWAGKVHGLKYAYLACGSPTEAKRFAAKAWERTQLKVTTKIELLRGEDRQKLDALSWDQQALVDFLMLEKSAHFTGCSFSSFAMNIAFKRHLMTDGITSKQWKSPGDLYSTLVGRFESWYGDWMFMYECMWP